MARRTRHPRPIGPRTHIPRQPGAWFVRVIRRGQPFERNFPDAVWGGRDAALVAAQRYRDKLLLRRIGPDTRVRRKVPKGSRSGTGIVGVGFEEYVVEGRLYHRYVAHWRD